MRTTLSTNIDIKIIFRLFKNIFYDKDLLKKKQKQKTENIRTNCFIFVFS